MKRGAAWLAGRGTLAPMRGSAPDSKENEEFWRRYLTSGASIEHRGRMLLKHFPHDPRCRLCAAPFAGPAAPLMRLIGKHPSEKTPTLCSTCFTFMSRNHGGAEIEATLLFADIRGSTSLAEGMGSSAFRDLLDRFYVVATDVVFAHDGLVDKFVGDELVSSFFPLLSGERHAARAVEAARALLEATGHADPDGPWVPVGAGIHFGPTWVGAVGDASHTELTVLGDSVNVTARLASAAAAGEILVTAEAARAAQLPVDGLERRTLELKGKQQPTEVVSLRIAALEPGG